MEDILAIILIFGGSGIVALAFSPIGRAIADRLRHGKAIPPAGPDTDPAIYDELDRLRADVSELQERLDFAERMLMKPPEQPAATE
ncbi:MAG TPA: hypothetical protein VGM20_03735 [Gemmatimonadales bacterium]|jgi:hypothetical protein